MSSLNSRLYTESSQNYILCLVLLMSRDAAEEEEGPGHLSGLCPGRREPGRLETQRRQSHLGAPMGAGEDGAAA